MVSIFNADKKELMAIFASTSMAASYIYGQFEGQSRDRVRKRLGDQFKITDSRFDFPLAVRHTSAKHKQILGENHGVIFEGYPEVKLMNIGGIRYTNFVNEKAHETIP